MSFEKDLKRLEEITNKLKAEDTGLEESITLFEEASDLSKKLNDTLSQIKRKVEVVSTKADDENIEVEEF